MFNSSSVTTVVAGQPPQLSPGRKASVFEVMFDNFKFGSTKKEEDDEPTRTNEKVVDEKTGHNKGNVKVEEQEVARAFSINETQPLDEPKRSLSVAIADVFRRPSESSSKSRSSSPQRKFSTSSSTGRKLSFFHSSNPDPDSEIPRNASIHSHHSSNNESADLQRKGSYVPRNATNSFLKSASGLTLEERTKRLEEAHEAKRVQSISAAAASRKASLALSDSSEVSAVSSGRRPSGMMPNNVASRYMRSASLAEDDKEQAPSGRRRSSRQGSNGNSSIKPVAIAPEQYTQWQISVKQANVGGTFNKPGETLERHRMQSLGGIAIAEGENEPEDEGPTSRSNSSTAPTFAITPASPPGSMRKKQSFSIDTSKANDNTNARGNKIDSAFMGDQVSPRNLSFGVKIVATTGNSMAGRTSGPQSPEENEALEKLGFRGAIPT
ncbi:Hypothetical protein D9617_6g093330 [Elsinoe fawcettii]|nr:Hypothetical protein D9617_6g093330 [Elsinoe fawcettii]